MPSVTISGWSAEREEIAPLSAPTMQATADHDEADQAEIHAVAVELGGDDVGEADHEGDRQVDAADDDDQRLSDRGDGQQRRQHQHGADRERRA